MQLLPHIYYFNDNDNDNLEYLYCSISPDNKYNLNCEFKFRYFDSDDKISLTKTYYNYCGEKLDKTWK